MSTGNIYDYAYGMFSQHGASDEMAQTMAAIAVQYCRQTGKSADSIYVNGQLDPAFLSALNSVKTDHNQMGYMTTNQDPNWSHNIILTASIKVATLSN
jgi:hypothetical protein